jgi:SAM-dependent methyltransferase/methyltransferase-like protein
LELACASGGNLIPLAWQLPQSHFTGIDLSAVQIGEGQARIAASGLDNIQLIQGDILDYDPGEQEFDYIIAHGLYSWVPAPVREKILQLCGRHLSQNGLAYISYNTLPGWRMRGMLRDMLLYRLDAEAPGARLQQAYAFLDQLESGLKDIDALHSQYLRHEIRHIRDTHPSYLYHEYLADTNQPFLYSEFIADAAGHGLKPCGDARLHTQFPATLGDDAMAVIEAAGDGAAQQQHYDFLVNRNFRQTLLCRQEQAIHAEANPAAFAELALFSSLQAPRKLDLRKAKPAPFSDSHGQQHPVSHPLSKAALTILASQHPAALPYTELEAQAQALVRQQGDPRFAEQIEHLFGELFMLFCQQHIGASPHAEAPRVVDLERPKAHPTVRAEATDGQLTGRRHQTLSLGPREQRLLALLDGRHDQASLLVQLNQGVEEKPVSAQWLDERLRYLARQGVLE